MSLLSDKQYSLYVHWCGQLHIKPKERGELTASEFNMVRSMMYEHCKVTHYPGKTYG